MKNKISCRTNIKKRQLENSRKKLVIIRPTVIFGEGNRGNVFNLINAIASKKFVMFGDGSNKKSMAYVEMFHPLFLID